MDVSNTPDTTEEPVAWIPADIPDMPLSAVDEVLTCWEGQVTADPEVVGDAFRLAMILGQAVATLRNPTYPVLSLVLKAKDDTATIRSIKLLQERGHIHVRHESVRKDGDAVLRPKYHLVLQSDAVKELRSLGHI